MDKINHIKDIEQSIKGNDMVFIYFSTHDCGICTSLLPKLEEMLVNYPKIKSYHISIDEIPVASGKFSVFTVPTVIVYVDGKEAIREARFITMDTLEEKVSKYYSLFFEETA